MKRSFLFILFCLTSIFIFAQAPEKFSFQAVVRDASNNLKCNSSIGVKVSILHPDVSGDLLYGETHTTVTNSNGLMTIEIGGGVVFSGNFASIDWANGSYFLKTETDPTGGTNYTIVGIQQLLSVPYSLYAAKSGNDFSGSYNDLTDRPTIPTIPNGISDGDLLYWNAGIQQWVLIAAGNNGQVLTMYNGIPSWRDAVGGANIPTVTTAEVNNITINSAISGGNVLFDGNAYVTTSGVCWSTSQNPTISDSHTTDGSGTNSFISTIIGLTPNTTYYLRAYAINNLGVAYGNQISFSTLPMLLPTVTTANVTNITSNSAICGGNVTFDGNITVVSRGVCWSTTQNPTIADNHTIDSSGRGTFTSSITGLTAITTYYVRAYATNSAGTVYGDQLSFSTPRVDGQPCFEAPSLTDADGNIYNTVQIGAQCWMKENLRVTQYTTGITIPLGTSTSTTTAYRYNPDFNSSNVETYGYLYNWIAVMNNASSSEANPSGVQGICPIGWHVPSYSESMQLVNYVSSQSQYFCGSDSTYIGKAVASTTGWNNSTTLCAVGNTPTLNNVSGFSALPAGDYDFMNDHFFGDFAYFWTATDIVSSTGYLIMLCYDLATFQVTWDNKRHGYSVRCVRDN